MYDVKNKRFHEYPSFRILLTKKERDYITHLLFLKLSQLKTKSESNYFEKMNYKFLLKILKEYTQVLSVNKKMIKHNLLSLHLILKIMEKHLYSEIRKKEAVDLYNKLSNIYTKRCKDQFINATK